MERIDNMKKRYRISPTELQRKIISMIMENPSNILVIKDRYITEDLWMYCIREEPSLFKNIKHPSPQIYYLAVHEDGMNIKYLKKKGIRITPDLVNIAVRSTPASILYVPRVFLNNELKEFAFDRDPSLMYHFRHDIRESYIENKLKDFPSTIQYIWYPKDEWIKIALTADPNTVAYIPYLSEGIKNFFKENYPNDFALIENRENNETRSITE